MDLFDLLGRPRGPIRLCVVRRAPAASAAGARRVLVPASALLTGGDLLGGQVAGVDEGGLDVVLVDRHYRQEVGRDDLDAVVVRRGVVGLLVLAGRVRLRGDNAPLRQRTRRREPR